MERRFGRYRLVEKIAQGGMAEVWRARQPVLEGVERDVVIKRILPHLANDPDFIRMFLNEARLAARFNHSNIAQIFDVGEERGSYFIAMEYVNGADLGRVMRKAWAMGHWVARPLAIRIVACCCEGLHYAHTRTDDNGRPLKIVHRDTSPANILVSVDGAVKLADFGIAKAADLVSVTRAGSIKGKFAYMSPEQATGRPVDHRSDLFSVALVLYELLTGVRPLRRETDQETHRAAVECEIEPPSAVSDVPHELDALVMRALAKEPDDRYDDVHQFRMALEEFLVEQRWVATSAQISELMRILFPDGVRPELPPGVSPEPEGLLELSSAAPAPAAAQEDLYGEDDPLPHITDHGGVREGTQHTSAQGKSAWSGPPRRIEILEGPDADTTFRLEKARVVVGRVDDCQVHLKDRSISRRHLELSQTPEGLLLRDLASGNGTKVNGEDVSERLLHHGDVVELGTTKFQYVDEEEEKRLADAQVDAHLQREAEPEEGEDEEAEPEADEGEGEEDQGAEGEGEEEEADDSEEVSGAAPAAAAGAAPEPIAKAWVKLPPLTKVQRRVLFISAGVALALGLAVCLRPAPPKVDPKQELAARKLAQAKLALADGRRDEAAALASSAERMWPGIDVDGVALKARRDQEAAEGIRRARLLLEAKDLAGAADALSKVEPLATELVAARKDVEARLEEAKAEGFQSEFDAKLAAKDFDGAAAMLPDAPKDLAGALRQRLSDAQLQSTLQEQNAALLAHEERAQAEKQRKASRGAALDDLFRTVDARLDAADYSRAVLEADHLVDQHPGEEDVRERAQRLKRIIPTFARTYAQAQEQLRQSDWRGAQRALKRSRELLAEGSVRGAVRDQCKALYVDAAVGAARLEASEQDWGAAAALYREALEIAPRDARAQRGVAELAQKAKQLLSEGESLADSQPKQAVARLKLAVELSEPGSSTRQEAKDALRRIEKLSAP